ncbi:MAG: hypothetical protein ACRDOH_19940, partial [Streptosporangiaceae bacterium]
TLWSDDVWVVDSTPVQCGCSRETVTRSDAAGWAEYGYCASHSRYFWGSCANFVMGLRTDLERHGGRTPEGILARVLARILALTAAIWHNDKAGQPVMRSLTAYDH